MKITCTPKLYFSLGWFLYSEFDFFLYIYVILYVILLYFI